MKPAPKHITFEMEVAITRRCLESGLCMEQSIEAREMLYAGHCVATWLNHEPMDGYEYDFDVLRPRRKS